MIGSRNVFIAALVGFFAVQVGSVSVAKTEAKQKPAAKTVEKEAPKPAERHKSKACLNVRKVCEAAGFVAGQANIGNGVWSNCLYPLKAGTPTRGIVVTPSLKKDVETCVKLDSAVKHEQPAPAGVSAPVKEGN